MAQHCRISGGTTNCTDRCKDCAKEEYDILKHKMGKAEFASEEFLREQFGNGVIDLLKEFNHIEFCGVVNGVRMCAI